MVIGLKSLEVPENYTDSVHWCIHIFKHHTVFDPREKVVRPLHLPEGIEDMADTCMSR